MTTINTTKIPPFGAITTYRVIHLIEGVANSFSSWNSKRKTYKELNALTARELNDVGISRAEVENFNSGLFRI